MTRYWPTSWSRRGPGPLSEDEREWREHDERRDLRNEEKRLLDLPCMCYNGTGPHLSGCPKNPRNITRQPEPRASGPGPLSEDEKEWREHDAWKADKLSVADMLGTNPDRAHTDGDQCLQPRRRRAACGRDPRHCDEWRCCLASSMVAVHQESKEEWGK